MSTPFTKRTLIGVAAGLGLLLGAAGVASAAQTDPAPTPVTSPADDNVQDPTYTASITAEDVDGQSEAEEATGLAKAATISPDEAQAAAQAVVSGTVDKVELDNENGAVVYSVEISDGNGGHVDVKVDAGNGHVLHQDSGND